MEKSSDEVKILFDTNFVLLPPNVSFDLRDELDRLIGKKYEIVIIPQVKKELKKIGKEKIGKKIIDKFNIKTVPAPEEHADQAIVDMEKQNTVVCTNDQELRKRLRKKRTPVIYLRGNKKLEIKGTIQADQK